MLGWVGRRRVGLGREVKRTEGEGTGGVGLWQNDAGAGIGGVLEPMQANPTIIGDNCFIGARSEIVEGVIVGEGSVVAMGVFITQSTKIVYRDTGEVIRGHIPPYSVVVPGTMPGKDGGPGLACAVIVKTVDAQTREKTGINDLLRD